MGRMSNNSREKNFFLEKFVPRTSKPLTLQRKWRRSSLRGGFNTATLSLAGVQRLGVIRSWGLTSAPEHTPGRREAVLGVDGVNVSSRFKAWKINSRSWAAAGHQMFLQYRIPSVSRVCHSGGCFRILWKDHLESAMDSSSLWVEAQRRGWGCQLLRGASTKAFPEDPRRDSRAPKGALRKMPAEHWV